MDEKPLQNISSSHFYRQIPPPNPELFIKSAKIAQSLLSDVQKVVGTIAASKVFAQNIMIAAQGSNVSAVTNMIRKTGTKTTPDISYTPDGLKLDFYPKVNQGQPIPCHIIIQLRWMDF
jgi:hypothetical protein